MEKIMFFKGLMVRQNGSLENIYLSVVYNELGQLVAEHVWKNLYSSELYNHSILQYSTALYKLHVSLFYKNKN